MAKASQYEGDIPLSTGFNNDDNNMKQKAHINTPTSFSWKGGKCKKGQCVGRVSISDEFVIEFTLLVHGKVSKSWESILHIGQENKERSPGIWLHPNSYKLHVRLSDVYDWNCGYDPNFQLEKNGKYNMRLECRNGEVSFYIDGKRKTTKADVIHLTRFRCPIWIGDPWHDAANCTVQNLKIYAP